MGDPGRLGDLIELASRVAPAGRQNNVLIGGELLEARICVDMQYTFEVGKMSCRTLSFAVRRKQIDRRRRLRPAPRPLFTCIDPKTRGLRPSSTGIEHRNGRVVGEQMIGSEHVLAQSVSVRRLHVGQLVTSVVSFQVRGRPVTDIRFAFEALRHGHDAKTFGFATEGPSLTRQEFAVECDDNVLMAYGPCLRPALCSSLRSSPSHPTVVSALRVTIAITNARKQWGLRTSTAKVAAARSQLIGHHPTCSSRR